MKRIPLFICLLLLSAQAFAGKVITDSIDSKILGSDNCELTKS